MIGRIWDNMVNCSTATKIAASLVLKDVVGCVMYTSTARSNKKYTPEKRADVANYDLANGVINIALQMLAIKPIENLMTKLAEAKLVRRFCPNFGEIFKKSDNQQKMKLLKSKDAWVAGSVAALSVIICQYFIKRFVSPYLSMPAAEKFQQWGLIKPKLYPGETYGEKSKQKPNQTVMADKFMFYRLALLSQDQNTTKQNYIDSFNKNDKK